MSKLSIIRQALETNPGVVIVNTKKRNYLPYSSNRKDFFCHIIDYLVAPKKGLYTADELQEFMNRLVPDLKPTSQIDFRQYDKNSDLKFGALYFDEKVGRERRITKRIIRLNDEELLNVDGFVNGEKTIDKDVNIDYIRRTSVNPFPNEEFARDYLDGKLEIILGVRQGTLKKYQPQKSLFQKLKRSII